MGKSIFRRPGTRHFQLVHRSQRDPLINDPSASSHVLREIDRSSGPSASDADYDELDDEAGPAGEDPAAYGIMFDDKEYDYMQHLRSVGQHSDAYLVEATAPRKPKLEAAKASNLTFRANARIELPEDALPSHPLDELTYTQVTESKAERQGLQLDLDPSVREVLEALDDDAYADEAFDQDGERLSDTEDADDFWNEIVASGQGQLELQGKSDRPAHEDQPQALGQWDAVLRSKMQYRDRDDDVDLSDFDDDDDTVPDLVTFSRRQAPGRDGASSVGTMTSSALFRNDGLRLLDDRFEQLEKDYDESENEEDERVHMAEHEADVEAILAALEDKIALAGPGERDVIRAQLTTPGGRGQAQLAQIRKMAAGADSAEEAAALRRRILSLEATSEDDGDGPTPLPVFIEDARSKVAWDCETVLSTYSNMSNHPRKLKALGARPLEKRILIDSKTGIPRSLAPEQGELGSETASEDDGESQDTEARTTVARPRNESAEEKKARKQAVKAERAARRTEKKSTKASFADETRKQKRAFVRQVADGASADVRGEGVRRIA